MPLICLYKVLLSVYNVSLAINPLEMAQSEITQPMYSYTAIFDSTYRQAFDDGLSIVASPFKKDTFNFSPYLPKPGFTAAVLLKPYDWKSWLVSLTVMGLLALLISIQTLPSCGGFFDSTFSLIRISLNQPYIHRFEVDIKCVILLMWLVAAAVLSEAYKGMILSLLRKPGQVHTPKSLDELLTHSSYILFNFETVLRPSSDGRVKGIPLLELIFETDTRKNSSNMFYGNDYHLLNQSPMQNTRLDYTSAAANFLFMNQHISSGDTAKFKIGNGSSTKFAYFYNDYTDNFNFVLRTIFPNLQVSRSVHVKTFIMLSGWFTRNGFLLEWYSTSLGRLISTGFAEAVENHWRVWNPCVSLSEVIGKLRMNHNVSNEEVGALTQVEKCKRMSLSGRLVGANKNYTPEPDNVTSLSLVQLAGIFLLWLICTTVAAVVYILEWIVSGAESSGIVRIKLRQYIDCSRCKNIKISRFDQDRVTHLM